MSKQQLLDELARLQEHEQFCHRLSSLLTTNERIPQSDYQYKKNTKALEDISDAISVALRQVDEELEHLNNQPLENFIHRRIR